MPKGGKREGAGRPKRMDSEGKPARVSLGCRVEQETMDFLTQKSESTDKSIGEVVDEVVNVYKLNNN